MGKKTSNAQTQSNEILTAKGSYSPLKILILIYFIACIVTPERTQKPQIMNLEKTMDKAALLLATTIILGCFVLINILRLYLPAYSNRYF